jgi:hypothetical protein
MAEWQPKLEQPPHGAQKKQKKKITWQSSLQGLSLSPAHFLLQPAASSFPFGLG